MAASLHLLGKQEVLSQAGLRKSTAASCVQLPAASLLVCMSCNVTTASPCSPVLQASILQVGEQLHALHPACSAPV